MDGATLRLLERLRLPAPDSVEAFVLLVVGRTSVSSGDSWWIASIVDEAMEQSANGRAAPFRVAYAAAADLPITRPSSRSSGWLAVEGLLSLPVPHRVAIALSCVVGFTGSEVAAVIDSDPDDVRSMLDDGIAAIRSARAGTQRFIAS